MRRGGSTRYCATGITSDSKIIICFIHDKHVSIFEREKYYILLGARTFMSNDIIYLDIMNETNIMNETKVSVM